MMQRLFVLFVAMLFAVEGWSQGENNIWTFGDQDGLNFNGGGPVYYRDSMYSYEGCASVCDGTGKLLFYSDGQYVYNRNHVAMPNSGGLVGHKRSSTQGVGIAKIPGYDSLYYLFMVEAWEQKTGKLRYSQIDMTLDGGLGDIVFGKKDIVLDSAMSEKMAFAGVCGQPWLITHHKDSAKFYAYKINSPATIGAPVVSFCGLYNSPWAYGYGEMKVSGNANRIAVANPSKIELYDFDESSGLVSNYMPIDTSLTVKYGIEFSPDMSKLYATEGLMQYDLSLPTLKEITDSKISLDPASSVFSALRTGPDDKIYFVGPLGSIFSRIEFPNLADTFCRVKYAFIPDRPSPKKAYIGIGLNAFIPKNKLGDTVIHVSEKKLCTGDTLRIKGYGYKYYNWSDGDTSAVKKLYKPGKVWLVSRINCIVNIDTYMIKVLPAVTS
ncbi:MAG TPA: hypothetical protein VL092_10395, partial [Chitinophagaceae bacterium]|nr:hypothetical protein [Chitinophagaceae bacterium]